MLILANVYQRTLKRSYPSVGHTLGLFICKERATTAVSEFIRLK